MKSLLRVPEAPRLRAGPIETGGFTLIEVMITVAIIGILAAVALPSYQRYVTRSKLPEGQSLLSGMGLAAQRYYQDNRTFVVPSPLPAGVVSINGCPPGVGIANGTSKSFNFACSNLAATTITMTATGTANDLKSPALTYTLDQNSERATPQVPTGWTANAGACWVRSQSGECS